MFLLKERHLLFYFLSFKLEVYSRKEFQDGYHNISKHQKGYYRFNFLIVTGLNRNLTMDYEPCGALTTKSSFCIRIIYCLRMM